MTNPSGTIYPERMSEPVSAAERVVLDKLDAYAVSLRDTAARYGQDDQWTRYAQVSTVVAEVLANGWEDPEQVLTPAAD
jgi:hypothetical protein